MNKNYNLKLDLQFRCNNSIMTFNEFDNNTSDFFMRITNGGKLVDIEKAIVVLAVIKPSGKVSSQFVEVENGLVYADLKPSMKDEIGTYTAKAMLILENERVVTDVISYEVEEDKIFSLLNDTVEATEEFTMLTDMLSRLSTIEISEEQRMINEAERILAEENRKIEEAKRVEAELIRQHEEADRAKYDATRESNENIRKQNESIRLANETNRIDEEAKRVEEENKRKLAEEERNANYNFMTEDEERRRSEANAHKEAEILRVQAETNRVNEEAKRRTIEQGRVSAENTRVSNENTRKANEETRQSNEAKRVEAETQRQSRYNSFITDAEANANNFETYTNNAKVKEEERKANELDRKSQEDRRVSNEVERISNEETRKANEEIRESNEISRQDIFEDKVDEFNEKITELNTTKENFISSINTKVDNKISELDNAKSDMTTTVSNKVNEVETRFNALTSSQQQDAEVIDARDGETSLKTRLDRDIEKAKQVYVNVEGSHISTDSSSGYAKNVEILGNTIQDASNLADIRSVGDKVEGQELYEIPVLSVGKNLFDGKLELGYYSNGNPANGTNIRSVNFIKVKPNTNYRYVIKNANTNIWSVQYDKDLNFIKNSYKSFITDANCSYIKFYTENGGISSSINTIQIQVEEGTVATPYEPYVEDKLTILSPVQLEKVGDVADRIICKDGVWGVEKNNIKVNAKDLTFVVYRDTNDVIIFNSTVSVKQKAHLNGISNKLKYSSSTWNDIIVEDSIGLDNASLRIFVKFKKSTLSTIEDFNKFKEDLFLLYQREVCEFIPLPHDQQIKLRTFANKTNISFLTEIEGTIKAQVPKSLGATVNTHTEQISNLNKELDRVKKLEESTVSTVTTESDFTTVEATSNGYFEDVKLEGKTLVNLARLDNLYYQKGIANTSVGIDISNVIANGLDDRLVRCTFKVDVKPNTKYTVIHCNNNISNDHSIVHTSNNVIVEPRELWIQDNLITTSSTTDTIWVHLRVDSNNTEFTSIDQLNNHLLILEGDHRQNPPSYFEGLKSVGQSASEDGADEIVVSSVKGDGNLFDYTFTTNKAVAGDGSLYTNNSYNVSDYVRVIPNCTYIRYGNDDMCPYDKNKNALGQMIIPNQGVFTTNSNTHFVRFNVHNEQVSDFRFNKGIELLDTPHQADKKRLLYYNKETQTWEKPILRQWDSIEKHADGKYYYHIRSVEEDYTEGDESVSDYITNMTTTVKPLAQEKVYECTNIDLITYANETNFIVESGAIVPRTTLKVHNNISNVVSLLQKKVSLLESNVKASQEVQDMMILETDMRMLDIELALMEFAPMKLNLGGSNMLRSATYFNFLKNHIINETYEKEYLENVMNKYLATGRINQDEYNELYKMLYPPVYDIELPIEY